MANRYWVGGSGTWNASSTANWSATSGGASGASVPTTADAVLFDANSGGGTVTLGANVSALTVTGTGHTGLIDWNGYKITVAGNTAIVWNNGAITPTGASEPKIELSYSGSSGTRTVAPNNLTNNPLSFYIIAGSDTVRFNAGATFQYNVVDFTGFSGTWSSSSANAGWNIYGNLTLSSTMTMPSQNGILYLMSAGNQSITSNGKAFDQPINFYGGGTYTLVDDLVTGSSRTITLTSGTLDAGTKNVTAGLFALAAGTKTLTMGSGTWTITGASWNANTNSTGLTVNRGTATITMSSASSKTFSGGGFTWPTLNQGGSGALTIAQSNTFANITDTVQPATITLTAGTTQTVEAFTIAGTAGNLITLNSSSAGVQATLSDASGTVSLSYVSIKDIEATGGAGWNAYTSNGNVDAGNNTGWVFDPAPSDVSVEFFMNLRSFTEPRRF